MKRFWKLTPVLLFILGCAKSSVYTQADAQAFIDEYTAKYMELQYASAEAEWAKSIWPGML